VELEVEAFGLEYPALVAFQEAVVMDLELVATVDLGRMDSMAKACRVLHQPESFQV